jgi:hypothetical protein
VNNTTNIKDSIDQGEKQAGIQLPVDLRDYFAAKAMQPFLDQLGCRADQKWFDQVAEGAYKMANAMMTAREKK